MAEHTNISWCDATWNPWRGCQKVSPGCANCYAETMAARNPKVLGQWGPTGLRVIAAESYWNLPYAWNRLAEKQGVRKRVFTASLADVFEENQQVVEARMRLFQTIGATPWLDYLLLTKRPEVARQHWPLFCGYWAAGKPSTAIQSIAVSWLLPNVWLGASIEDNARLSRVADLVATPAVCHFLSIEPLLEPITFSDDQLRPIDWVIVGGESGPRHRPCKPEWIRSILEQCIDANVACFIKQDSGTFPGRQGRIPDAVWRYKQFPTIAGV